MSDFWERLQLWNAEDIRDAEYEVQCFALSERSRKLCLALVDSVSYSDRYKGAVTQDEIDGWQADLAYQLMGENEDCAPGIDEDEDCTLYMPDALFIDYAPNDPFQTPDLVPDGYLFVPPWYTNPGVPLPGVLPTDAMVNFLAIGAFGDLAGLIASGLPRFHMDIDGEGEVELEFVKVPQGGNVLVIQDNDPLQQQVFDLNALQLGELGTLEDLFDIVVGESLNDTAVCEIHFATAGLHTIDVTFFPNIAADVIVGMGGGLRRVSLCGVAPEAEVSMPQFQVVDCVLQWRPNGSAAWADLVDLCAVQPPTIVRQDPTPPGNMQQDIGGAGYTDIPDTDFVWRNGAHPMTGGLEIYPTADEILLTLKGVGSPYQTNKIMRVQDSAGVDRAWINPRGDIHANANATSQALILESGSMLLQNGTHVQFKDGSGNAQVALAAFNGLTILQSAGGGMQFRSFDGFQRANINEAGVFEVRTTAPAGVTKYQVRAGLGNGSTSKIVEYLDLNANVLASVQTNGEAYNAIPDAATNTIVDVLTLHHFSSASPSAGFGAAMRLRGKTSTSDAQNMARLYAAWETPTHATRAASVVLSAYDFSGEKKIIEGGVTGASTPKIGFLGITPQPRLAISGDHQKNPMTKQIVEALALFGLVTDATTDVEQFVLTGETGSWPLLQSFVDGLVTFSDYFVDTTSAGDCELVCEVPPPELWCKEFDFTDEDDRAPWVIERGQVGTGFESTMIDEVVFIHTAQFETFRIISVTIFYNQSSTTDATILFGAYDFAGYISHDWGNVDAGTGQQVLIDFSPSYDAFSGFRIVATSTDPAQQVQITGLKVEGYDMGIYGVIEAGTDCP